MNTHRTYRLLTALLSLILLLTLGCLPALAAEDLLPQNQAAADETVARFSALVRLYNERPSDSKQPADRAIEAIGRYSAEAAALISSDTAAARTEDLRPDFSLLYAKGELSARLTWIAYAHGAIDEEASSDAVRDELLALCEGIRLTERESVLSERADELCIRMNRTVFKKKIHDLPRALGIDESHVLSHLRTALDALDALSDPDTEGAAYVEVYERTRHAIVLEQSRLLAKAELGEAFDLLGLPSADKLHVLSPFAETIARATSTSEINRALLASLRSCLVRALSGNGPYVAAYRLALLSEMESAVETAGSESVASLCRYLNGEASPFHGKAFAERAAIAYAKDAVEALRLPNDDPALFYLFNTYVEADGILERCESREALQTEVVRVRHRAELSRDLSAYLTRIEQILPTASATALLSRVRAVYTEADDILCGLSLSVEEADTVCATARSDGIEKMEAIVREAEAERFRIIHADVLKSTEITEAERPLLLSAIEALKLLPSPTQALLAKEAGLLGTHYRRLTAEAIRAYVRPDACLALREETIGRLARACEQLSTEALSPAALRVEADAYLARARAADRLLCHYADIRSLPRFGEYDTDSIELMETAVTSVLEALLRGEDESPEATILALTQRAAIAELRLAAGDAPSEKVCALLADAEREILSLNDASEISACRERLAFRITACRRSEEMRQALADAMAHIGSLRGLSDAEKEAILHGDAILTLAADCEKAEQAADTAALDALVSHFSSELASLLRTSEAKALSAGICAATALLDAEAEMLRARLFSCQYLSETHRASLGDRLTERLVDWQERVLALDSWERLDLALASAKDGLSALAADIDAAELSACREAVIRFWESRYDNPTHYSAERYEAVLSCLAESRSLLAEAGSISALHTLRDRRSDLLSAIPTRLDETKTESLKRLEEAYQSVLKNRICYQDTTWKEINEIYEHTLDEIGLFTKIEDISSVLNIAIERSEWILSARKDFLYTSDDSAATGGSLASAYPNGYHPEESGYWAKLSSQSGIPHDARFSVRHATPTDAQEQLLSAIRRGSVVDSLGNTLAGKQLSILRDGRITHALAIEYSHASATDRYWISLLLPSATDVESILGIVYIRDDGCVEFYDFSINKNEISFETSHFSNFYIVSEKAINLTPLIVLLAFLLFCEIAAILLLLAKRHAAASNEKLAAVMPALPLSLARRITPNGGVAAAIILSFCLAAATAVLIRLLLENQLKKKSKKREEISLSKNTIPDVLLSPISAQETPATAVASCLPSRECFTHITPEVANEMMSDAEATEAAAKATQEHACELSFALGKRIAVNIDVISKHFKANDTVSLETLKACGIVPKNAKAVKILARGALNKPLTVIADDFSATALKMILLTGGEAIFRQRKSVE